MTFYSNIIFLILFFGMLFIIGKILMDTHIEKIFKQGRVNSIRVAIFLIIIVSSFLVAFAFREVILAIYNLFI